jgi:predicted nuclease with RNAse H fold
MKASSPVFIGVDVGATSKGFHAVALRDREVFDRMHSRFPGEMARWCREHNASAIGVDAPCRWRNGGQPRSAERALAREKISAFATPSYEIARSSAFYRWMLNGAALYGALEKDFPLFEGLSRGTAVCFETFPQAIACALAGQMVSAKQKCARRRTVLENAGVATARLTNIDYVDAALCAVAARYVHAGTFKSYGDASSGFILVPCDRYPRTTALTAASGFGSAASSPTVIGFTGGRRR